MKTVIKKRKDVAVGECYRFVDREAARRLMFASHRRSKWSIAQAVIRCLNLQTQRTEFKRHGLHAVWGQSVTDYYVDDPRTDPKIGDLDVEMLHHYTTHPIPTPIEVEESDRHLCDLAAVRMLAADVSVHGDLQPISNEQRQAWSRELARKVKASDEQRAEARPRIVVENDEDYFA